MALADQIDDPILSALTAFRVANALLALGRPVPAFNLNISHVSRLEARLTTNESLSVYGNAILCKP